MTDKHEPIQRRAERLPFSAEIELRRRTRSLKYRVTIRDFSPAGASLNLVDRVELGEIIWIKLDGLESIEANVRWTRDFVAGVKFAKPLHPSVFAMLIERQTASSPSTNPLDITVPYEKPT